MSYPVGSSEDTRHVTAWAWVPQRKCDRRHVQRRSPVQQVSRHHLSIELPVHKARRWEIVEHDVRLGEALLVVQPVMKAGAYDVLSPWQCRLLLTWRNQFPGAEDKSRRPVLYCPAERRHLLGGQVTGMASDHKPPARQ